MQMMDEAHNGTQAGTAAKSQSVDFDSMHLQVGSRLQLIRYHGTRPVNHFTTLIGYVKDDYLLVKIPLEHGTPITLNDGERLNVRTFSGTSVCSFPSTVERVFLAPFFYMHLSFPRAIEGSTLRKALRVKVNIPARLTAPDAKESPSPEVPVMVSNLSVAGALIESEQEIIKENSGEQSVSLSFTLVSHPSDLEVRIKARATIRNVTLQKASSPDHHDTYTYGVQFIDLEPTHQIMLQNLTYEAIIEDRQKVV